MRRLGLALAFALTLLAGSAPAGAGAGSESQMVARGKARVKWSRIDVPEGKDAARLTKLLRKMLDKAVKQTDFGDVRAMTASARIVELRTTKDGDVLRVTCVLSGKLEGGQGARSKISLGGDPNRAGDLEAEVLQAVANGLVTRLAELARAQAAREAKAAD
jgi:hypothetical protein